ncbi:MAG: hypothetical protein V1766_12800 [Pseudomonadota bacterium]
MTKRIFRRRQQGQLARVENIRKFRILDKKPCTGNGKVTPTMKVKRSIRTFHATVKNA